MVGAKVKNVCIDDRAERRAELGKMVGRTAVPFIFVGGKYIGGFDGGTSLESPGISDLAFAGKLAPMLEAVGVKAPPRGGRKRPREVEDALQRFSGNVDESKAAAFYAEKNEVAQEDTEAKVTEDQAPKKEDAKEP